MGCTTVPHRPIRVARLGRRGPSRRAARAHVKCQRRRCRSASRRGKRSGRWTGGRPNERSDTPTRVRRAGTSPKDRPPTTRRTRTSRNPRPTRTMVRRTGHAAHAALLAQAVAVVVEGVAYVNRRRHAAVAGERFLVAHRGSPRTSARLAESVRKAAGALFGHAVALLVSPVEPVGRLEVRVPWRPRDLLDLAIPTTSPRVVAARPGRSEPTARSCWSLPSAKTTRPTCASCRWPTRRPPTRCTKPATRWPTKKPRARRRRRYRWRAWSSSAAGPDRREPRPIAEPAAMELGAGGRDYGRSAVNRVPSAEGSRSTQAPLGAFSSTSSRTPPPPVSFMARPHR